MNRKRFKFDIDKINKVLDEVFFRATVFLGVAWTIFTFFYVWPLVDVHIFIIYVTISSSLLCHWINALRDNSF